MLLQLVKHYTSECLGTISENDDKANTIPLKKKENIFNIINMFASSFNEKDLTLLT